MASDAQRHGRRPAPARRREPQREAARPDDQRGRPRGAARRVRRDVADVADLRRVVSVARKSTVACGSSTSWSNASPAVQAAKTTQGAPVSPTHPPDGDERREELDVGRQGDRPGARRRRSGTSPVPAPGRSPRSSAMGSAQDRRPRAMSRAAGAPATRACPTRLAMTTASQIAGGRRERQERQRAEERSPGGAGSGRTPRRSGPRPPGRAGARRSGGRRRRSRRARPRADRSSGAARAWRCRRAPRSRPPRRAPGEPGARDGPMRGTVCPASGAALSPCLPWASIQRSGGRVRVLPSAPRAGSPPRRWRGRSTS